MYASAASTKGHLPSEVGELQVTPKELRDSANRPWAELVHEAMTDAPHDGELYRQARAAIRATRAEEMASMLRRLEYGADDGLCCLCHGYPERGHSPTCDLSILLKELP